MRDPGNRVYVTSPRIARFRSTLLGSDPFNRPLFDNSYLIMPTGSRPVISAVSQADVGFCAAEFVGWSGYARLQSIPAYPGNLYEWRWTSGIHGAVDGGLGFNYYRLVVSVLSDGTRLRASVFGSNDPVFNGVNYAWGTEVADVFVGEQPDQSTDPATVRLIWNPWTPAFASYFTLIGPAFGSVTLFPGG